MCDILHTAIVDHKKGRDTTLPSRVVSFGGNGNEVHICIIKAEIHVGSSTALPVHDAGFYVL